MNPATLARRLGSRTDVAMGAVRALHREIARLEPSRGAVPPRALLVGGAVRDALLERDTLDLDVEVFGVDADRLELVLGALFPGRIHAVGRAFGIFKVALDGGHELDVALPRRDSKIGPGHRGFRVSGDPLMDLREAARRRDFTVNAMSADPVTGELHDPCGGLDDLSRGVLRAVDPETFPEDPLRVWRAIQLAARFELVPEPSTLALLRGMVERGDLATLSRERVTEEIRKLLLQSLSPSIGMTFARDLGIVRSDFPELDALTRTPQDPEWHPEGDVWIHTLLVIDRGAVIVREPDAKLDEEERLHVMLGCLCHDLGKPATTTRALKDGVERIVSPNHEVEGEAPTRSLLGRLTFGDDALHATLALVRWHFAPYAYWRARERGEMGPHAYANAIRRVLKRIHPTSWRVLLAHGEADWRGRALPDADGPFPPGDSWREVIEAQALDREPTRPLVLGRDVLALGVPPGPRVGRLVERIEASRDAGEITTREEALEMLRKLVGSTTA